MILNKYLNFFLIYNYVDLIEILFFTILIYYCSMWLSNDKQKNLLFSFYLIFIILIISNFVLSTIITSFLISFLPTILVLFFLFHQNTLQKNFITLKKLIPSKKIEFSWINELLKACMIAMNNNKQLLFIIQGNDLIDEYLKIPLKIFADINSNVLKILIDSSSFDQEKILLINLNGKLESLNCSWNLKNNNIFISEELAKINDWKKNAIILTSKLDCLIFKTFPATNTFDIVLKGRLIENLSVHKSLNIIEYFVKQNNNQNTKINQDNNEIKFKNIWSHQSID